MSKQEQNHPLAMDRRSFLHGSAAVTAGLSLAGVIGLGTVAAPKAAAAAATAAPAVPPKKALLVERHLCTGCGRCAYACSVFHDGTVRPATARIYTRRYFGVADVTSICWHCGDSPCVSACPVQPQKAIEKKEGGYIGFTDESLCLGAACNLCVDACPPGYLRRHPETAHPMFCDLCLGDPQCVKACAQQSQETGVTLRADTRVAGLHWSFREVGQLEAAEGIMKRLFYPNLTGERIDLFAGRN